MINNEDALQRSLELLERGGSLDDSSGGLQENEAELLKLASQLRGLEFPLQDSSRVAEQHNQLIEKAKKKRFSSPFPGGEVLKWALPLAAGVFICVALAAVAGGIGWLGFRAQRLAENPGAVTTEEVAGARATDMVPSARETSQPPNTADSHASGGLPSVVSLPEYDHPKGANLRDIKGLVEIQDHDGTWLVVNAGHVVAGQRVRTGAFSSVTLALFDGSRVHVGPETEISVEKLNAPADGARKVLMTQWVGETEHDVVPSDDPKSFYEVETPSAHGLAKGTSFQVVVLNNRASRFIVSEGVVAVTSLKITIDIVPGQVIIVNPGESPGEPVFRITGEGEVSSTGQVWTIAGQTFQTHDHTIIVGNPQVGDLVQVDGHLLPDGSRVADRIVLLRRAVSNRFSLSGEVETIGANWTIAGQIIQVNGQTVIDEDIAVRDSVRVEGIILPDGTLQAQVIKRLEEAPGLPFQFSGIVQAINEGSWIISGQSIALDDKTVVDEGIVLGDVVAVRGWILQSDTWLAGEIRLQADDLPTFEFTGIVQSMEPWQVAGIGFEVRPWTVITPGINIGDRVRVRGSILTDGTWVADAVTSLVDMPPNTITFVGVVTNTNPWVVNGLRLNVTDDTSIPGSITVGSVVVVQAQLLPDGTWTVLSILPLNPNFGFGCLIMSTPIIAVNDAAIQVKHWHVDIKRDGRIKIRGDIKVNSIVTLPVCTGWDGSTTILGDIVIIYQPTIIIINDGGGNIPSGCKITPKGTLKCSKKSSKKSSRH